MKQKRYTKSEGKGGSQVEIKTDPARYTSTGASKVSLKGTDHMTSYGSQDEYEAMEPSDQAIYEETF